MKMLGAPLENQESEPHGFAGRDWKPAFMNSSRHRDYAFQWFALGASCFVMWVFLGFRRTYVLDTLLNVILAYRSNANLTEIYKDIKRLLKWSDKVGK